MGTREAGFASSMPGYRKFESADGSRGAGRALERAGRAHSRRRAAWPIRTSSRPRSSKQIRALWIIATNPIVSFPNLGALQQALEGLEFLVVQDGYHPTPTTEFADLVLPAAIWGEKEGTYTNSERRVSKVNRAVAPPGEARLGLRHLSRARRRARRARRALSRLDARRRDAFDEWKRVSAGRLCDYSGMTYEAHRAARRRAVAVSRRRHQRRRDAPPLRRRRLPDRRRPRAAASGGVGAVPRAAERRVPVRAEHRPHGRALAHAHQDRARCRFSSGCRRTPGSR